MKLDEKELIKQLDEYFDNVTKEQFLRDLEESKSLKFVEDIKTDKCLVEK